jgi:hypothetical protein
MTFEFITSLKEVFVLLICLNSIKLSVIPYNVVINNNLFSVISNYLKISSGKISKTFLILNALENTYLWHAFSNEENA